MKKERKKPFEKTSSTCTINYTSEGNKIGDRVFTDTELEDFLSPLDESEHKGKGLTKKKIKRR